MPIYDLKCKTCGAREDHSLSVAALDDNRPQHCGAPMDVVLHASTVGVRADCAYKCPATGEIVTTRRKRRYLFEKHDLRDADDYASNFEKTNQRAQRDRELGAKLYADVPDHVQRELKRMQDDDAARALKGS